MTRQVLSSAEDGVPDSRYRAVTGALNFALTNRLPRVAGTKFMGWFSRIEHPLIARPALALWRAFADLQLHEARKQRFRSIHDCFVRELKPGARPINPEPGILTSPCDAIVGASGRVEHHRVYQAKEFAYSLSELVGDPALADRFEGGVYTTLRITSTMYHRFHAPYDCTAGPVTYFSGDAWNVNPPALARVDRLFVRNEHAVVHTRLVPSGHEVLLVPVAAILVAGIRLHFADVLLNLRYRGANRIDCEGRFAKGEEMGWFEHGSTILVFAPRGFRPIAREGATIRVGQPLMGF